MILVILLTLLSLSGIVVTDSYQDIAYQPNSPLYNFIFSEKFPPQVGTTRHKIKDQTKSPVFVAETVAVSKPDFTYTYGEKKVKETWFDQIKRTFSNLNLAFHDLVDVTLIRAFVDLGFDGMSPKKRLPNKGRTGTQVPKKNERQRKLLTFILGGFLGEQDCSSRALCEMGRLLEQLKGKNLVFMIFESVLPAKWKHVRASVEIFQKGTKRNANCHAYICNEERNSP